MLPIYFIYITKLIAYYIIVVQNLVKLSLQGHTYITYRCERVANRRKVAEGALVYV